MSASRSSKDNGPNPPALLRHGLLTRWLHGLNALAILVLLVTGLALGDRFSDYFVASIGGHETLNDAHQWLGIALAAALLVIALGLRRSVIALLRETWRCDRPGGRWLFAFIRYSRQPEHQQPPFHDGRFDPAQRVVFAGLLLGLALITLSGILICALPDMGRIGFMWTIRTHLAGAWLLLACLTLHVIAGLGLPRTHRGLLRTMFGDGRVRLPLAQVLWPGWAARQLEDQRKGSAAP